jgi:aldehyde:ferredoxin oxidoreductase
MIQGYGENILEVDLTSGKVKVRKIDGKTLQKFIGGIGIAAKILWDETKPNTKAFSSENLLVFMTGPLTGSPMPTSSRCVIAGISPLTNIWGEAHVGGNFADGLRRSGFDGVIVRGKSTGPVYIWIHDSEVEIRDASSVWGFDTWKAEVLLRNETDKKAIVATIGPAGEKLVKFASIVCNGVKSRVAARCGLGAVMGFKRLKAIVVKGSKVLHFYDEKNLKQAVLKLLRTFPKESEAEKVERYVRVFKGIIDAGGAPIKNWRLGKYEPGYRLAEELRKTKPYFCRNCPTSCTESRLTNKGERHMVWQAWAPLGLQCLIGDPEALQDAYTLCNKYGMDSISTGSVISFAMELVEKGLVKREGMEGINLNWGNSEAMLQIIKKIGEREGFGELLGEGVERVAQHVGGLAKEYVVHVKGLELPAHDPRASSAYALHYATSNLGAAHFAEGGVIAAALEDYYKLANFISQDLGYPSRLNRFEPKGKGVLVAKAQNFGCMIDSLIACYFLVLYHHVQPSQFTELLRYATGWRLDLEEFMKTGERIFNLKRMFNVRRGISRKDDILPLRVLTHKRAEGEAAESLPFLGLMLNEYYSCRGWSEEGIPKREKLVELDLKECVEYAV